VNLSSTTEKSTSNTFENDYIAKLAISAAMEMQTVMPLAAARDTDGCTLGVGAPAVVDTGLVFPTAFVIEPFLSHISCISKAC
jgi:hypothetical protein